jgi:predicted ATPase
MDRATLSSFAFGVVAGAAVAFIGLRSALRNSSPASSASSSSAGARAGSGAGAGSSGGKKLVVDMHNLSPDTMKLLEAKGTLAPQLDKRVFTVCLTGGPCSGKSSSLSAFAKALTNEGLDVYSVPEVPTIIMNSGFPYPGLEGGELLMEFEVQLFKTQLQLEDTTVSMAEARDTLLRHRPSVVFFDRGLIDMKAYMPPEMWAAVLERFKVTEEQLVARYDLVLHLVTAADGALGFYTTANNAARTETAEQARENDRRVRSAWDCHPHRAIVDNSGPSFQSKIDRATDMVLHLVHGERHSTELNAGVKLLQSMAEAAAAAEAAGKA